MFKNSLHLKSVLLPKGYFCIYIPVPEKVAEVFKGLHQNADISITYWARLWPAAIALAAFLQKNSGWLRGKTVAEFAAGLGLPSLVAATYAKSVWCSDISAEAMEVAAQSATLNQLTNLQFEACNWNNLPDDFDAEVVLLSDINYNPSAFDELEKALKRLLQMGCMLLLATPQRLMAKPFFEKLSGFIASSHEEKVEEDGQNTYISIFVLRLAKG